MTRLSNAVRRGRIGARHLNSALAKPTYAVATVPAPAFDNKALLAYVTDGAAGSPCLAFNDGTSWKRVLISRTISAGPSFSSGFSSGFDV